MPFLGGGGGGGRGGRQLSRFSLILGSIKAGAMFYVCTKLRFGGTDYHDELT